MMTKKMTLEEAYKRMSANICGNLRIDRYDPYIELPDDLLLIDHLGTFNSLWERIYFDFLKDSTSNDS